MEPLSNTKGCSPTEITNWLDLQKSCPRDPVDLIAYADIGGAAGIQAFSSNYIDPGGAWVASTATLTAEPTISALESDNLQMVADATQWNFQRLTWNSASSLAIPLRKLVFLRGGLQWTNRISFSSGGAAIDDLQLSFLGNAATRGDKQATVPVIQWAGLGTNIDLHLTLKLFGHFTLGFWLFNGANYQMFDLDVISIL